MISPAVVNAADPLLLVSNASSRPETLYKGQQISWLFRLIPLTQCSFLMFILIYLLL
ncbi:unnamed protein product [Haemonchus placei]|uniref:Uncharacterized protein n=1 Tax=Haemonchus placei TaxID=6290 RepID=A0A0N4W8K3_HAEPC|nr:unnamed protein product [Haemonchus placei]